CSSDLAAMAKALGAVLDHGKNEALVHVRCKTLLQIARLQQLDSAQCGGLPEAGLLAALHAAQAPKPDSMFSRSAGHSWSVMLYSTVSSRRPSANRRGLRNRPSRTAPSFSIAQCERRLLAAVFNCTRTMPQLSKACLSIRYLMVVFRPLPC